MGRPSEFTASGVIFFGASIWGLYWIPVRFFEGQGIDGGWAIALLNAPAAVVLLPFLLLIMRGGNAQLGTAVRIGFVTGLGIALYATSLIYTDVVRATLLFYLTPIWATLIGIYWMGERPNWQRWAAIALGLFGLLLLVSGNTGRAVNFGDLAALASGVTWAIGASMIRHNGQIPIIGTMFFQFAFMSLISLGLGMLSANAHVPEAEALKSMWWLFVLVAAGFLVPAVLSIFWAQQFLSAGRAGLLMMSEVLVAMISASILLPEERLSTIQWVGALLIVAASVVELIPARRATVTDNA